MGLGRDRELGRIREKKGKKVSISKKSRTRVHAEKSHRRKEKQRQRWIERKRLDFGEGNMRCAKGPQSAEKLKVDKQGVGGQIRKKHEASIAEVAARRQERSVKRKKIGENPVLKRGTKRTSNNLEHT